MSEARPHLSIGEVLSLLQDEFPDVTISKIRFLESQGLLNPERTPSGYRKFYDHDVEQLRWVLRQQKENFLPLKVIKDRLAAGQLDGPASESGVLDLAPAEASASTDGSPLPAKAADPPPPPAGLADGAATAARPGAAQAAARRPANRPVDRSEPASSAAVRAAPTASPAGSASGPAASTAPARATGSPPTGSAETGGAAPEPSRRTRPDAAVASSASLTTDELCSATGVSPRLLAELERYGLVDGRSLGAETVYDDEAMVICRLAVTMSGAGIEARHLRMFKVAAEREAGLYEQLALPTLRGKRPDGRQEAVAQVTALTGTAAELHAALLRRALRGTFGPL